MGLTSHSVGRHAVDSGLEIHRHSPSDRIIAVAGNPNVGKSTVFNGLTGMKQHTGNWPGKTVANAQGYCTSDKNTYILVDIPGTYSLMAHSAEEEVARNFICFGGPDAVLVVCDATCLERNLNLVLQILEITGHAAVCVNLMDEAERKQIHINLKLLSEKLGVPVIGTTGRDKRSVRKILDVLDQLSEKEGPDEGCRILYSQPLEAAISLLEPEVRAAAGVNINSRWASLRLLGGDKKLIGEMDQSLGIQLEKDEAVAKAMKKADALLLDNGMGQGEREDCIVSALVRQAEEICREVVCCEKDEYHETDRKIDRLLTGKWVGYPVMLGLLAVIFWLTITGANYPSRLLSEGLFWIQEKLTLLFEYLHAPAWLHGALVLGVYRVLAWVVSVMLPPMAIFFPLFTLLEDVGYLPRVAYNLDKPFHKCGACGKQSLSMCMGFGCNAAGVIGCRIIDSPRERLLAILTNSFVPCNGRFPQPYEQKEFRNLFVF